MKYCFMVDPDDFHIWEGAAREAGATATRDAAEADCIIALCSSREKIIEAMDYRVPVFCSVEDVLDGFSREEARRISEDSSIHMLIPIQMADGYRHLESQISSGTVGDVRNIEIKDYGEAAKPFALLVRHLLLMEDILGNAAGLSGFAKHDEGIAMGIAAGQAAGGTLFSAEVQGYRGDFLLRYELSGSSGNIVFDLSKAYPFSLERKMPYKALLQRLIPVNLCKAIAGNTYRDFSGKLFSGIERLEKAGVVWEE